MSRATLESVTTNLGKALGSFDSAARATLLSQCQRELRDLSLSVGLSRVQRKSAKALLEFLEGQLRVSRENGEDARNRAVRPQPKALPTRTPTRPSGDRFGALDLASRYARFLRSIESGQAPGLGGAAGPLLLEFVESVASALRESRASMVELDSEGDLQWFLKKAWSSARQSFFDCVDRGALPTSKWLDAFVTGSWMLEDGCEFVPELVEGLLRRSDRAAARDRQVAPPTGPVGPRV